jgi:ATP-dependent Lon protease
LRERLEILITLPDRQKLEKEIEEKTREVMRKDQNEYYLRTKAKVIKNKLRESGDIASDEMLEYLERLKKEPYPDYVKEAVRKEIERYEPRSGEAHIIRQYID